MTSWKATPAECRALAKVVHQVRGRSGGTEWGMSGIEDALDKARTLAPYPDLCHAAVAAAREPSNRTPAVIGLEGPHWRVAEVPPSFRPPDPWTLCFYCGKTEDACRVRTSSGHTFRSRGEMANQPQVPLSAKQQAIAEAKAHTARRAGLVCEHGAKVGVVKCALCDAEKAKAELVAPGAGA